MAPAFIVALALVAVCALGAPPAFFLGRRTGGFVAPPAVDRAAIRTPPIQYFANKIDHFNPQDNRTYQQRYLVNDTFFKAGGPVFININGEAPVDPIWASVGSWVDNAAAHNALCVLVEHRFYGGSQPFDDLSTANLAYLTSEQALEDLADLHAHILVQYGLPATTKTIVFGGSYSGALSAWFRTKYPHIAAGAVANSAPVHAEYDFVEYMEVTTASMATSPHGTACTDAIATASAAIDAALATPAGRQDMATRFRACSAPVSDNDVANFMSTVAGSFMGVVQYNNDNRAFEGATNTNITVDVLCDIMANADDALAGYTAISNMLNAPDANDCWDPSYANMVKGMQNTSVASEYADARTWTYQTCAEFAYFQSTDGTTAFGNSIPVSFYADICTDVYGPAFTAGAIQAGVNATNTHYGGRHNPTSNIVWVNGDIDQWHALSVLTPVVDSSPTVLMTDTAHCAAMYPARADDAADLVAARKTVSKLIATWLSDD